MFHNVNALPEYKLSVQFCEGVTKNTAFNLLIFLRLCCKIIRYYALEVVF